MSDYAIGDLQGCLDSFNCLLKKIRFNADKDRLFIAGDLINRGPDSLGTLRRVYDLRENLYTVLGNHDLHLLAVAHGQLNTKRKDTFDDILNAKDRKPLLKWLQKQPLLVDIPDHNAVMTHAGIPPLWSLKKARKRAAEVETVLRKKSTAALFFDNMYGNQPAGWSSSLEGPTRWRVITNYFTRMRFVNENGELELTQKGEAEACPPHCYPWFLHPKRKALDTRILFGHWAALNGETGTQHVEALDTGCVWGGALTALRLDDNQRIQCDC